MVPFLPRVDAQIVILVWRTSIPYPLQRLALLLMGQVSKQLPSCITVLGPKRQLLYGVSSVMGRAWTGLQGLEQEEGQSAPLNNLGVLGLSSGNGVLLLDHWAPSWMLPPITCSTAR